MDSSQPARPANAWVQSGLDGPKGNEMIVGVRFYKVNSFFVIVCKYVNSRGPGVTRQFDDKWAALIGCFQFASPVDRSHWIPF